MLAVPSLAAAAGKGPDYFGTDPNYANSPIPTINPLTLVVSGGIRKFVNSLPGVTAAGANGLVTAGGDPLGQYIPLANPDVVTYPDSDYYEIEVIEYFERMHSDLPAAGSKLRGYRQTNLGTGGGCVPVPPIPTGSHLCTAADNTVTPSPVHYLGPLIVAQRGRPTRIKFTNSLPAGTAGDLFIPTDTSVMGAGNGPDGTPYSQNRATLHLHGGLTPWISDGTPHQWTVPALETSTNFKTGDSTRPVPDMPLPAGGSMTFYWPNQQSGRLMFYHDHAYGITRLNVYGGEAAGYLLVDPIERALTSGTTPGIPAMPEIPLVIQDKTFVPATTQPLKSVAIIAGGAGYTSAPAVQFSGGGATTQATATATVTSGEVTAINVLTLGAGYATNPIVTLAGGGGSGAAATAYVATLGSQDPTWDTAKWGPSGSLWFPHVYMPNQNPWDLTGANAMGRWDYALWFWPPWTGLLNNGAATNPYYDPINAPWEPPQIPGTPAPSLVPEAFLDTPIVNGTAYPYLRVDPKAYRFRILNAANDRFWNLSLFVATDKTSAGATTLCNGAVAQANCTEVKMVPFNSTQNAITPFPSWWYTPGLNFVFDDRAGGVPDPTTRGPAMIQIGSEGGLLPAPVVIKNQPVNYTYNRRDIVVLNIQEKALLLGPAERADVIVDFSNFAGKTLILYNDAPAPVPAADSRNDYYTGSLDQTDTGGAPPTLPGYGPNTRTIMQIQVSGSGGPGPVDDIPAFMSALQAAFVPGLPSTPGGPPTPGVFAASQDPIIVAQAPYNSAYGGSFPAGVGVPAAYARIQDTSMTFGTINGTTVTGFPLQPKAIQELFETDYGRMNATLGIELPFTNANNQTTIPFGYVDPPTEILSDSITPLAPVAGDGTQIWKITHNGVDTHAIHFHLFNVQVINRVGWDGAIRPPDGNELGWKETVRMNPLEDIIVAMRPVAPKLPFGIPDSVRYLNPALPPHASIPSFDPLTGMATTITNELTPFGWEYVWHCHLLGHEENDMMRPMVFDFVNVIPNAPALSGGSVGTRVNLSWTDPTPAATSLGNPRNEIGFLIERAPVTGGVAGAFLTIGSALANATTYSDTAPPCSTCSYHVLAYNAAGSSLPSNNVTVSPGIPPPSAPLGLTVAITSPTQVLLSWTDNSNNETSFAIWRSVNAAPFVQIGTVSRTPAQSTATGGAATYLNGALTAGNTYAYYVIAVNGGGISSASNTVSVLFAPPSAPTNLIGGRTSPTQVVLNWTDTSSNEASFSIQRATNSAFTGTSVTTFTVGANVPTFTNPVVAGTAYYYRVRAVNLVGNSAYSNTLTVSGFSVAGTISPAASGAGTTLTLTQAALTIATATAAADGTYTLAGVPNGTYTATPSKVGFTFTPASTPVTVNNANVTGINFTAIAAVFSVAGTISPSASGAGATLTLTQGATTITTATAAARGAYTLAGVSFGAYTVTPSKAGFTFVPASSPVNVNNANVTGINFTAMPSGVSAVFVRADATTQGTWLGVYGLQGYMLANGASSLPAYAAVTLTGQFAWTWVASTTDVRALQRPAPATDRFAATWYNDPAFSIDVNLTDGLTHRVAVYGVDYDSTTRVERIDVVDAISGAVLDSRTLAAFTGGQYLVWDLRGHVALRVTRTAGVNAVIGALMFDSSGPPNIPPTVTLTSPTAGAPPSTAPATIALQATASDTDGVVTRVDYFANSNPTPIGSSTSGPTYAATWNGVAAGIYSITARATDNGGATSTSAPVIVTLNPASGGGPSAVFVRADPTTQGTWQGVYGLQGYTLANGASSLPAYAAVTLTGQLAWTFAASTTDVRALQRPAATDRFAAAWYNNASFSMDVNLTDGLTHRVAVYAVDWDSTTRAERIDVVDAISGTVLDSRTLTAFNAGQYLVWDLRGHVTLRVTHTAGDNAVISAVFFD